MTKAAGNLSGFLLLCYEHFNLVPLLYFNQGYAIMNSAPSRRDFNMKIKKVIKDIIVSVVALFFAFVLSIQFQKLNVGEHITTIFVFAVFMISLFTTGYLYGIIAGVIGTVAVNYAFTYPYFAFDFIDPSNAISAVIMVTVAIITSLLVTKIKYHEAIKAEGERERMRANLLRAISHDLRTPLTTIYSASTMLKDNGNALTNEQKNTMLQNMQEDAKWLIRMVENLLSVTRIDNNTMKITKVPTILDELVDSAMTKFTIQHPTQKVKIELPDEIIVIPMDAILIEQVILNLLENAIYHAEGMSVLSLKVFSSGNNAIFEIADDGCGIDEKKMKHLFMGCYEVQQDMSGERKRFAGIGLSVCATIIKAHGGNIMAENLKSGGALLRFSLEMEKIENGE